VIFFVFSHFVKNRPVSKHGGILEQAQLLIYLFGFAVKKFCGSSLDYDLGFGARGGNQDGWLPQVLLFAFRFFTYRKFEVYGAVKA
jgi:hypothetical protein